jgi:cytochrome c oxidase subunit II
LRTPVRILIAAAAALTASLALAATASADLLSPESGGSPNADTIDSLYWIVFVMAMIVLVGVWATLLYSMIKFRARRGAVPAQIRGNTRLEIGWTVGAALVLVVIAVVTFVQLGDIRSAPASSPDGLQLTAENVPDETDTPNNDAYPEDGRSLRIQVTGLQYNWRYSYLDGDGNTLNDAFDYTTMVVPTDTTVTLEIKAQDVIHSWWIPELGGKFDAVPGHTNYTWMKVPGRLAGRTFRGQCAELCGRNHANMVAYVKAVTPQEWEDYIERRKREIADANEQAAEQRRQFENQR